MFRQILVPVMLGRPEFDAARLACAIAAGEQGAVDVLVGMSAVSPMVAGWDYFPAGVYDTLDEATTAAADKLADEMREALKDQEAIHEVRVAGAFWMTPAEQARAHAHVCDLIVLGRPSAPTDADDRLFAALLLGSGRPVLTAPSGMPHPSRAERVLVAWKPSREAARAVHDALPLLESARHVEVLTVAGMGGDRPDPSRGEFAEHLRAHGIDALFGSEARGDRSTGQAILQHARKSRADLIVAGGYGHAKAVEQVFGGVTRVLYRQSPIPVLFSH